MFRYYIVEKIEVVVRDKLIKIRKTLNRYNFENSEVISINERSLEARSSCSLKRFSIYLNVTSSSRDIIARRKDNF